MCYSVETAASYVQYVEKYGAHLSLADWDKLLKKSRRTGDLYLTPTMETALLDDPNPELSDIQEELQSARTERLGRMEKSLGELRERLKAAEAKLAKRETKAALNERRIATNKIASTEGKIAGLLEVPGKEKGSGYARIYSGNYAPVMCVVDGEKSVLPMRYLCRPPGVPAEFDQTYPGAYNARLDKLIKPGGYWKALFRKQHAVIVAQAFHEFASAGDYKLAALDLPPDKSIKLRFSPVPKQEMLIPCIWSRWKGAGGEELLSFAVITTDPPPEVEVTGHDRCPLQIKPENVDAWLYPEGKTVNELVAILTDRPDIHYRHELETE